ncbi:MAG: ATP-dependent Clp protease proteolytic subunit [Patescibacteria group bacterium]
MNPIYIVFQAGVDQATSTQLLNAITNSINAGVSEINLLISSPGGSIFHGMSIASLIRSSSVPINTYNIGQIDSIAGVIYAAGNRRFARINSSFLFHGVTANFSGNLSFPEQQLAERLASLKRDRENIAKDISLYTGADYEKVDHLMKESSIISAEEAKELGIVEEIADIKIPKGVQVINISN